MYYSTIRNNNHNKMMTMLVRLCECIHFPLYFPMTSSFNHRCKLQTHSRWSFGMESINIKYICYVFIGNRIPTTCSMFNFIVDSVATIVLSTQCMVTGGSVFSVRIEFTPYADRIRCHCRLAIAVCCPTPNHALQRRM